MYSMTGYDFKGSKYEGRIMMPHIGVTPSRPGAENTSGACQPSALSRVMSALSNVRRTCPSLVRLNTVIGGISTVEYVSIIYCISAVNVDL